MITEIALLTITKGQSEAFEEAFIKAQPIIEAARGYIQHELQQCLEQDDKYLLTVRWDTLEDHTVGFRLSEGYKEWKKLLHHFYNPFPVVEHYKRIF
ncbi:MAG: antibiotic biosynthesis monooxygenase family protein [Chitinophagaceae bacterium]